MPKLSPSIYSSEQMLPVSFRKNSFFVENSWKQNRISPKELMETWDLDVPALVHPNKPSI